MSPEIRKYFPNSTKLIIVICTIIGGVLFSLHVYGKSNDLNHTLKWGIGFTIIMLFFLVISEVIDRRQHKSKLDSSNFRKIKEHFNFEIENHNEYWGFKGVYKNYFIRLFFDNLVRGGRLGILIYYQQPKKSNGEVDIEFLDNVNSKYEINGILKSTSRVYDTSHIRIVTTGWFNRRFSKVVKLIENGISTLNSSKLKPISETQIDHLIENDKFIHTPLTETYEIKETTTGNNG